MWRRCRSSLPAGFYDGIVFHRVIDGFMAQTGDPTGTGTGGSQEPDLQAEFSKEHFGRGTVGMARSQDPNSANSAVLRHVRRWRLSRWPVHGRSARLTKTA